MTATVTIEERQLGGEAYVVLILRPGERVPRSLWGRYMTWTDAQRAAGDARAYLAADPAHQAAALDRLAEGQAEQTPSTPLYLLPNLAKLAFAQGLIRKEDYGRTWAFQTLKIGEPVNVDAYMKKAGIE